MSSSEATFEERLVAALQPIRFFALAQAIHQFFESGIFEKIRYTVVNLSDIGLELGMDELRLEGFLRYLENEKLVEISAAGVQCTPMAESLREFAPWYQLLVGGYAITYDQITATLRNGGYATRNGHMVGVGSCAISEYDAIPLVRELIEDMPMAPSDLIDIGCGNGAFMLSLLGHLKDASGIGVDPYAPESLRMPRAAFVAKSAVEYVADNHVAWRDSSQTRLVIAAFLLQEILEQSGRSAVVDMLRNIIESDVYIAVVEVDQSPVDQDTLRSGLGLAYYNPYFLVHELTEQRLETREFWYRLFAEAGAEIVRERTTNANVDSTGLEFGCLLRRAVGQARC